MVIKEILIVGTGGFIGSALRFVVGGWVQRATVTIGPFPVGTLAVNVTGCLAIGLLGGWLDLRHALDHGHRLFWLAGLLGGFTTFSAFAFDTLALAESGALARAFLNVALQVFGGLGAAALGFVLGRMLPGV